MPENSKESKKIMIGNASFLLAFFILTTALWNEYAWYEKTAPFATLISFAALSVTLFCYVGIKEAVKDPYFIMMAAATVIAAVNLFIVDSGKGAWLTAADVLIVIYLSDRIKLSKPLIWAVSAYTGFFFFYWTYDVKGYFKGYNTNYGGLVLLTGFVFAVLMFTALKEKLKETEKGGAVFLAAFIVFLFLWGYNIIAWYRARCALLGFVVFLILLVLPQKVRTGRIFYSLTVYAVTAGAILVSLLYVFAGVYLKKLDISIFYKDIISGRDEIWADLWRAFLRSPVTGIGSSYRINVDWMGGMFEVHNGLLDILIVHGIIVFAVTLFLLIKRLLSTRSYAAGNKVASVAMSGVFAMLAASFMENFFIVPPFLLAVAALIAIARSV